jgi:hypothetical protein
VYGGAALAVWCLIQQGIAAVRRSHVA